MTPAPLNGSCLCGTVRYRITGEILNFQYCHCSRCRKFTGAGHATNMFTGVDSLEWTGGAERVGHYSMGSTPGFLTSWCTSCGSSLPNMSSTGKFWVVPAGTLDDETAARPRRNIFWGSRADWFEETHALPKHDALPESEVS